MICTFFGHKNTPNTIKNELKHTIINLIEQNGVTTFYVGNNGNYDLLVQRVLKNICSAKKGVNYFVVLSHLNEQPLGGEHSATIFPYGLEFSPQRLTIVKRNEWMIKQSQFVIAYVEHQISNSYQWIKKAEKKGLLVINLFSSEQSVKE